MPEIPTCECVRGLPPSDKLAALYCQFKAIADGEIIPDVPVPDILWWEFTNGSGATVTATVGPNGTTDATWITGKSGSGFALDFNGTTQDAVTNSAVTYGTNTITVCGWFWLNITTFVGNLLESGPVFSANSFQVVNINGVLYANNYGDTGQLQNTIACPSAGAWVHIAIVFSPTDNKFYINGVVQASSVTSNDRAGSSNYSSLTLNVAHRSDGSLFFPGRIDDLRIYSGDVSADLAAIMADAQ